MKMAKGNRPCKAVNQFKDALAQHKSRNLSGHGAISRSKPVGRHAGRRSVGTNEATNQKLQAVGSPKLTTKPGQLVGAGVISGQ
jgi:hypothetical protein